MIYVDFMCHEPFGQIVRICKHFSTAVSVTGGASHDRYSVSLTLLPICSMYPRPPPTQIRMDKNWRLRFDYDSSDLI